MRQVEKITPKTLDSIEKIIRKGEDRYGTDELSEESYFIKAFTEYPLNNTPELVAMKIALVDTTQSTNLSRILGNKNYTTWGKNIVRKVFNLTDLVNKIIEMPNFDERIKAGDVSLVSELSKWSKDRGANIMSFFSKYCSYHNYHVYGRDDFPIYDSVVQQNLGRYLSFNETEQLFPNHRRDRRWLGLGEQDKCARIVGSEIENMKKNCKYEEFRLLIDNILELRGINPNNTKFQPRRKLDYLVWYSNRG